MFLLFNVLTLTRIERKKVSSFYSLTRIDSEKECIFIIRFLVFHLKGFRRSFHLFNSLTLTRTDWEEEYIFIHQFLDLHLKGFRRSFHLYSLLWSKLEGIQEKLSSLFIHSLTITRKDSEEAFIFIHYFDPNSKGFRRSFHLYSLLWPNPEGFRRSFHLCSFIP